MERTFIAYKAGGIEACVLSRMLNEKITTADFVMVMQKHEKEKAAADEFVKKDGWMDKKLKEMSACMRKNATRAYNWLGNAIGQKESFDLVFPLFRCKFELAKNGKEIDTDKVKMDSHVTTKLHDCFITFARSLSVNETKDVCANFFRKMESIKECPSLNEFFEFVDEIKREYGDTIGHAVTDETIEEAWERVEKNKLESTQNGLVCYQIDEWEDMYQVGNNPRFTRWCVSENTEDYGHTYFDDYEPPYYMICKGHEPIALLNPSSQQFKDANDSEYTSSNYDKDVIILGFKVLDEIGYEDDNSRDFEIFDELSELDPFINGTDGTDYNEILNRVNRGDVHVDSMKQEQEQKNNEKQQMQEDKKKERVEQEKKDGADEIMRNLETDVRYYLKRLTPSYAKEKGVNNVITMINCTFKKGGSGLIPEIIDCLLTCIPNAINDSHALVTIETWIKDYNNSEKFYDLNREKPWMDNGDIIKMLINSDSCTENLCRKLYADNKKSSHRVLLILGLQSKCPDDVKEAALRDFPNDKEIIRKVGCMPWSKKGTADGMMNDFVQKLNSKSQSLDIDDLDDIRCGNFSDAKLDELMTAIKNNNNSREEQKNCIYRLAGNQHVPDKYKLEILDMKACDRDVVLNMWTISRNSRKDELSSEVVNKIVMEHLEDILEFLTLYGSLGRHASKLSGDSIRKICGRARIGDSDKRLLVNNPNCPYDISLDWFQKFGTSFMQVEDMDKVSSETAWKLYNDGIESAAILPSFPPEELRKIMEAAKADGSPESEATYNKLLSSPSCPKDILEKAMNECLADKKNENQNHSTMTRIMENTSFDINKFLPTMLKSNDFITNLVLMRERYGEKIVVHAAKKIAEGTDSEGYGYEAQCYNAMNRSMTFKNLHLREVCIRQFPLTKESKEFSHIDEFAKDFKDNETCEWVGTYMVKLCDLFYGFPANLLQNQNLGKEQWQIIISKIKNPKIRCNADFIQTYLKRYGLDSFMRSNNVLPELISGDEAIHFSRFLDEDYALSLKKNDDGKFYCLADIGKSQQSVDTMLNIIDNDDFVFDDNFTDMVEKVINNLNYSQPQVDAILNKLYGIDPNAFEIMASFTMVSNYLRRFGVTDAFIRTLNFDSVMKDAVSFSSTQCIKSLSNADLRKALNEGCQTLKRAVKQFLRRLDKQTKEQSAEVKAGIMARKMISAFAQVHRIAYRIAVE